MMSESWFSMTRRRLCGQILMGGGAFLSGCGFARAGEATTRRAEIRLDRVPSIPEGMRDAVAFPFGRSIAWTSVP